VNSKIAFPSPAHHEVRADTNISCSLRLGQSLTQNGCRSRCPHLGDPTVHDHPRCAL
jgi:hypothetical protein